MMSSFSMLALSLTVTTLTAAFGHMSPVHAGVPRDVEVPLVRVNEDTITTDDLQLELDMMEKMRPESDVATLPEPGSILRRLIQNQLILQEGYRMGANEDLTVSNQVLELRRSKGMVMLLDSVALSVPEDTPEPKEARRAAVQSYVEGLMRAHAVSIDSTLLHSLDYGSADEAVQKYLHTSNEVLAVVPTGRMTVARFSKVLRFQEFHGLVGKPDAAERRDKAFNEWVTEAVLSYQAKIQRLDDVPSIRAAASGLERFLVRQETINALLETSHEPQNDEIRRFYEENIASYMSPGRIKMKSKKLNTKEAAEAFREKLVKGADIEWLAGQDPEVVPGKDPFPYDWFLPEKLGLKPEDAAIGVIPGPYGVPGGWVVAFVSEIEEPTPIPLSDCRSKIVAQLKSRNRQKMMTDIMSRLEEASEVEVLPGAEDVVQRILAERR